jgi:hypothetical protein
MNNDRSDEETDNPNRADDRNFYKVEKWTKDGMKIESMLCAGNNLEKARDVFTSAIRHRPRTRACTHKTRRPGPPQKRTFLCGGLHVCSGPILLQKSVIFQSCGEGAVFWRYLMIHSFRSGLDRLRPEIPTMQHMERRPAAVERSVSPGGEGFVQWQRA